MAGISSSTSVFAVVGLGVLGVAGFNTLRTGCPTCFFAEKTPAAATAGHADAAEGACPLGCEDGGSKLLATSAAHEGEEASCCAAEAECDEKEASGCCSDKAADEAAEPVAEAGGA